MQYTAKNIENFMQSYEKHVSHYIVAHTHFRPFINPQSKYTGNNKIRIGKMAEQASKDCRYALNCFSKLLYPTASNKPVRLPYVYRPLTFVTIEGANETTDKAQTIHVNIALGNLPEALTTEDIVEVINPIVMAERDGYEDYDNELTLTVEYRIVLPAEVQDDAYLEAEVTRRMQENVFVQDVSIRALARLAEVDVIGRLGEELQQALGHDLGRVFAALWQPLFAMQWSLYVAPTQKQRNLLLYVFRLTFFHHQHATLA